MVAVVGVAVLLALALVALAEWSVWRAEAQAAADAAALAGAVEGRTGAVDLAQRNGGELISYQEVDAVVVVEVRVGRATATAAATIGGDLDWAPIT
jgi:hypothetical protein